ncbi:rho GTPase-activating protein 40 [Neolamprologus brichardi]|uniref:rho GTPase-activating protein 40 n=1 Tax=Neolamprologus brichardi TaxID=32507 RepID=UPI0003EBC817|nr:rho GTPase-activating protein 40 [Neolamprologus brichardi]
MGGRAEVVASRFMSSMPSTHFSRSTPSRLRLRPQTPWKGKRVKISFHKMKARDPSPTEMSVEPWASPQDQAAAELSHSEHTDTPPSQDQEQRPDKLCLDSFWSEVENIQQGSGYADDCSRRDSKHSEEGEQEEQWLADAGLSTLISEDTETVDKTALLSTLTKTQAEAVKRRVETYTLRKRNKPPPRDVRDIFSSQTLESQHSEDPAQNSMASVAKSPLSAVTPEHQRGTPKDEYFITDVAYCEQAVILIKQAKLPQNNSQRRKEDGTLPRVICPKCRLGVTRIQDLSHADMKKVRQLALIDMTALCDLLELEVKRHKTGKRKNPESPLFGVPLATLLENDQKLKPSTSIPLLLQELLSFLEKKGIDSEGILRVPGSQSRIKLLQQNLEANFYSRHVRWDEVSPNDAAALLKKFIRELPAPLLTAEYLNNFSAVREITELKQKLHMLNLLILLLPEPNRNTLKALLEFLSKVVSKEKKNRMNLWAVATIMAPNLFLHKAVPSRLTEGGEKGQAEKAADVMRLLIRYQDLLWTTLMHGVACVSLNRNGSVAHSDCALYEVGGNIGEHCLDPDTHLLDLYNSNPGGEWIIKRRPSGSRGL